MSSLRGHAGRPHIAAVLVQNHRNDPADRVAFEIELRVDDLVKELVLGAREDWEGRLPRQLCFQMIAREGDIEYAEIEPVLADVIAERGAGERGFPKLGGKLRQAQLRSCTVAVLVQDK